MDKLNTTKFDQLQDLLSKTGQYTVFLTEQLQVSATAALTSAGSSHNAARCMDSCPQSQRLCKAATCTWMYVECQYLSRTYMMAMSQLSVL